MVTLNCGTGTCIGDDRGKMRKEVISRIFDGKRRGGGKTHIGRKKEVPNPFHIDQGEKGTAGLNYARGEKRGTGPSSKGGASSYKYLFTERG